MAAAKVQTKTGGSTSTTDVGLVWGSNTTTGNTIVVATVVNQTSDKIVSVADSQTNTYTKIADASKVIGGDGLSYVSVYYAYNITGGVTPTITIDKGTNACTIDAIAWEISGLTTTDPLDKVKSAGGTTTAVSSGNTATLSQADEYLIGIGASDYGGAEYTLGVGYGNLIERASAARDMAMEDRVVSSAAAYAATFKLSDTTDNYGGILTFLIPAAFTTSTSSSTSSTSSSTSTSSTSSSTSQSSSTSSTITSTSTSSTSSSTSTTQSTSTSFSTSSTSSSTSASTSSSTSCSTSQSTSTSSSTSCSTSQSTSTSFSTSTTQSTSTSSSTSSTSSSTSTTTTYMDVRTKPSIKQVNRERVTFRMRQDV